MADSLPKLRQRVPWLSLLGILVFLAFTFGRVAANILAAHVPITPDPRELQREEQQGVADARRQRIDMLLTEGDRCRPAIARELARALVFDGRSAVTYADDYERRCGEDPIVRRWAEASHLVIAHVMRGH